jgi:hypothetical protein
MDKPIVTFRQFRGDIRFLLGNNFTMFEALDALCKRNRGKPNYIKRNTMTMMSAQSLAKVISMHNGNHPKIKKRKKYTLIENKFLDFILQELYKIGFSDNFDCERFDKIEDVLSQKIKRGEV